MFKTFENKSLITNKTINEKIKHLKKQIKIQLLVVENTISKRSNSILLSFQRFKNSSKKSNSFVDNKTKEIIIALIVNLKNKKTYVSL